MTSRGKDFRRKKKFYTLIPLLFWLFGQVALLFHFALGPANSEPVLTLGLASVQRAGERSGKSALLQPSELSFPRASLPPFGDVHPQGHWHLLGWPCRLQS